MPANDPQSNEPAVQNAGDTDATMVIDPGVAHREPKRAIAEQAPDLSRAPEYALVVHKGQQAGRTWLLSPGVTRVGRHPYSDVALDHITVSRRHCRIELDSSGLSLKDLGSTNGSYVNDRLVEESSLNPGDRLMIGTFPSAGGPRSMNAAPSVSIGRVTDLLREEFPDLTTSKVRFLESRGMIRPARSPAGYRQFNQEDIERLRFILQRQRDHFLPLKVIKSQLADWSRGPAPAIEEPEAAESEAGSSPDDYALELQECRRPGGSLEETDSPARDPQPDQAPGRARGPQVHESGPSDCTSVQGADRSRIGTPSSAHDPQRGRPPHRVDRGTHGCKCGGTAAPKPGAMLRKTTRRGVDALRRLNDLLFLAEVRTILDED